LAFSDLFSRFDDYDYFDRHQKLPARWGTSAFSKNKAWWLAELAQLSYVSDAAAIVHAFRPPGATEVTVIDVQDLRCLVVRFGASVVVAFRGTVVSRRENLFTDARVLSSAFGRRGHVHQGFYQALKSVWRPLNQVLRKRGFRYLWFTGHSLGAAMAILAADKLADVTTGCFAYGCPRVGDKVFCKQLKVPLYRIVNNNDIIDQLPPPGWYRHAGEAYYIDSKGLLWPMPGMWHRIQESYHGNMELLAKVWQLWRAGDWQALPFDWLNDHSPKHYSIHLWNVAQGVAG